MTTAFVLSGGANLGAVQVGMLLGLADAGIAPDVIIGASVGAINGAWISSRPDAVIATDVLTGEDVRLSAGNAVDAILASAAIPGIFPPIEVAGRQLIDGGVVNNTPLCPIQVSPIDFSQTGDLIDRSYESTREWLVSSPPRRGQAKLVEPHGH